jgi:hypothetical protein
LLFATNGAVAVSWLPEPYRQFSAYSTLAKATGIAMEFVIHATTASTTRQLYDEGYQLDLDSLDTALDLALAQSRA